MKPLFRLIFKLLFGSRVQGLEHLRDAKGPFLIVCNHVSLLDGCLIHLFLPLEFSFIIDKQIAQKRIFKPFLFFVDYETVDLINPHSIRRVIQSIRKGKSYMVFPEGRLSQTGGLMKIEDGIGMIVQNTRVAVLPLHVKGAELSKFSYIRDKMHSRWFPRIELAVCRPRRLSVKIEGAASQVRKKISEEIFRILTEAHFEGRFRATTIFERLIEAVRTYGGKTRILEDVGFSPVTYGRILTGSFALGRKVAEGTEGKIVGILLPNSAAALVTFMAIQARGKVPAMLNFTSGAATLAQICRDAGIDRIVTARAFVRKGKLESMIKTLAETREILYLEDVREGLGTWDKAKGLFQSKLPRLFLPRTSPEDDAVVIFTSGSEGAAKGVVLSHSNVLANIVQCSSLISLTKEDKFFNALPMFHSFGLTAGTLLPLFCGASVFLYPTPLHYRLIPALSYQKNCTVMFGTDTFYSGYGRKAHPYEFYGLKYAVAGAEKLKEETKATWHDKFGVRIFEGYGATEASPVIAVNTPIRFRQRSVGCPLPFVEYRLEKVDGIEEGGKLWVKGPNVMKHYLVGGEKVPPAEGWHDTGDVVRVDEDGFIYILGRLKRFAKIAGEMVSLTAVEEFVGRVWPENPAAAFNLPDPRKGEKIVLLVERENPDRKDLAGYAKRNGIAELMIPREVYPCERLPIAATGKVDYRSGMAICTELSAGKTGKTVSEEDEEEEDFE